MRSPERKSGRQGRTTSINGRNVHAAYHGRHINNCYTYVFGGDGSKNNIITSVEDYPNHRNGETSTLARFDYPAGVCSNG